MANIVDQISVCMDCMILAVNGEIGPDEPQNGQPEPWALIPGTDHHLYAMGVMAHEDYCPDSEMNPENCEEYCHCHCQCDNEGFGKYPCQACGTHLAGDRYSFVRFDA